jgi:hypothetical protein
MSLVIWSILPLVRLSVKLSKKKLAHQFGHWLEKSMKKDPVHLLAKNSEMSLDLQWEMPTEIRWVLEWEKTSDYQCDCLVDLLLAQWKSEQ